MNQPKFSFNLTSTNPSAELGFEVWINDQCVVDIDHVNNSQRIQGMLPTDSVESDHVMKLVLKNKQPNHTQVSSSGEIVKDSCLEISNLTFDTVELNFNILQTAVYRHNFNGTADSGQHKFYGVMGCSGTVELRFSTPIYLWLLEHM